MSTEPNRHVEGRTLVSDRMPAIRIRVDDAFEYVDRLRFVLYGAAQVELFLFAAHDHRRVDRLVLVQFEGYLDDNDHVYDYPITEAVTLGGDVYLVDTLALSLTPPPPPDSDFGRVLALLRERRYILPLGAIVQRFVRVLDEARRNEILICYGEATDEPGPANGEVAVPGRAAEPSLAHIRELRERALDSFSVFVDAGSTLPGTRLGSA